MVSLTPTTLARLRVLQWVLASGLLWVVSCTIFASMALPVCRPPRGRSFSMAPSPACARRQRVLHNLAQKAKAMGMQLVPTPADSAA